MALAHAVQGATRPSQVIVWTRLDDDTPEVLTGATLTGKIRNVNTGATRDIVGTLIVTDGANGVFTWSYDAADVVDTGAFSVQFTATFSATPTPARTIVGPWVVHAKL